MTAVPALNVENVGNSTHMDNKIMEKQMKCPIDGEVLLMTARNGVEIDYCPSCRGVWLDRGELDKIIERAATAGDSDLNPEVQVISARRDDRDDEDDKRERKDGKKRHKRDHDDDRPVHYRKSRDHASFIKELFDF